MRIAIAQLDFRIADFDGIFAQAEAAAAKARDAGADLLVFTELAISGYPPADLLLRRALHRRQPEAAWRPHRGDVHRPPRPPRRLRRSLPPAPQGRPLHNAAALCVGGRVVDRTFKTLLPTYDVFDEDRYFEPASASSCPLVEIHGRAARGDPSARTSGTSPASRRSQRYDDGPRRDALDRGSGGDGCTINLSASPFSRGKPEHVRRLLVTATKAHARRRWFVYANQVGGHDELLFDGLSRSWSTRPAASSRAARRSTRTWSSPTVPGRGPRRDPAGRAAGERRGRLVPGARAALGRRSSSACATTRTSAASARRCSA